MSQTPPSASSNPLRQVVIDLGIMTLIGILLALIGPLGSFQLPFAYRLVYWLGLAWAGYACYRPIGGLITQHGAVLDLPDWSLWLIGCLVATVPMTLVVWLVSALPPPFEAPSLESWLVTYGYVLAIGAVVTMVFYLVQQKPGAAPADPAVDVGSAAPQAPAVTAPAIPQSPRARLLRRLPPHLGSEIVALEMEDHYLRVHTRLGNDLILLRMRDALAELDGLDGAQVHRSWWVARAGIMGVERDGRSVTLALWGGLKAPVARSQVTALKAAGWL